MTLRAPIHLVGAGVELREWAPSDVAAMSALFDDPEVARWTPLEMPFTVDAAERYLRRAATSRTAGQAVHLAITRDEVVAGEALLMVDGDGEAELGYMLGAPFRGLGLATAAVGLLADHACTVLGFERLLLRIAPGNAASNAVARRLGFRTGERPLVIRESRGRRSELATWIRP